ncbi:hypothetical protein NCAS_0B07000 [Naumovozyma castellii]|uniref:Cytochrome c oxidase-assembly factor COX23, mitochondrial n=1 Tax=Naumovozyma castellii TaxID=27288 RepID=G0VA54_NAUCA|nr:hypothetical protein NCAS_0B07000 [Naumovozyma castellii CBS 4309]CCC68784.1 hypothetical protein NCAS_0B07000 [Naumovozyma castellii CBS 4309]
MGEQEQPEEKGNNSNRKQDVNFTPDEKNPGSYKYFPDDPVQGLNKYKFIMKGDSEYYDPCQECSEMSRKCLERNPFDKSQCQEYFDAYRDCKKMWMKTRRENRKQWEK